MARSSSDDNAMHFRFSWMTLCFPIMAFMGHIAHSQYIRGRRAAATSHKFPTYSLGDATLYICVVVWYSSKLRIGGEVCCTPPSTSALLKVHVAGGYSCRATHTTPTIHRVAAVDRLTACIADINDWMKASRLRLNPAKTQIMWLGILVSSWTRSLSEMCHYCRPK